MIHSLILSDRRNNQESNLGYIDIHNISYIVISVHSERYFKKGKMGLFVRCYSYGVHRDVISTGRRYV